jgi:hypothetical protein
MRSKTSQPQLVRVRPLVDRTADANVFGDAPVIASDNRETSFEVLMQVNWASGDRGSRSVPGRGENLTALLMVTKRDIARVPAADGWEPNAQDIVELVEGDRLFIFDVQPAFPERRRMNRPRGGFGGWRISVTDGNPSRRAADSYDK